MPLTVNHRAAAAAITALPPGAGARGGGDTAGGGHVFSQSVDPEPSARRLCRCSAARAGIRSRLDAMMWNGILFTFASIGLIVMFIMFCAIPLLFNNNNNGNSNNDNNNGLDLYSVI